MLAGRRRFGGREVHVSSIDSLYSPFILRRDELQQHGDACELLFMFPERGFAYQPAAPRFSDGLNTVKAAQPALTRAYSSV
ncbi:hypothetical protein CesoFtcFv8_021589 [Champsocephalus esox]|uniref:Uncharacterized protein n=1 Tax=Champsocephalus esox TaxID=159716 RepID=A0AAN8BA25_9TELE|nr:hypothetical protein CesoFtcFv8_021589 [Champsocephalus esox]